jgi:hypothetical protein
MSHKIGDEKLDTLGRRLFKGSPRDEKSADHLFLAAFRRKLEEAQLKEPLFLSSLGQWCWKISPITVAASVFLVIFLATTADLPAPGNVETDQVLWTLVDSAQDDLSEDVILGAILFHGERR